MAQASFDWESNLFFKVWVTSALSGPIVSKDKLLLIGFRMSFKTSKSVVKDSKRRTRRKFSSEEKIHIFLEGSKGEESIITICRREGITPALYHRWSSDFLEARKKKLQGDNQREVNTDEVDQLRKENQNLKEVVAELTLDNLDLKTCKPAGRKERLMGLLKVKPGSGINLRNTLHHHPGV